MIIQFLVAEILCAPFCPSLTHKLTGVTVILFYIYVQFWTKKYRKYISFYLTHFPLPQISSSFINKLLLYYTFFLFFCLFVIFSVYLFVWLSNFLFPHFPNASLQWTEYPWHSIYWFIEFSGIIFFCAAWKRVSSTKRVFQRA